MQIVIKISILNQNYRIPFKWTEGGQLQRKFRLLFNVLCIQ